LKSDKSATSNSVGLKLSNDELLYSIPCIKLPPSSLLFDTGASVNIMSDSSIVTGITQLNTHTTVYGIGKHIGTATLRCTFRDLGNAIYMPDIGINLISGSVAARRFHIQFDNDSNAYLLKDKTTGVTKYKFTYTNGVYVMDLNTLPPSQAVSENCSTIDFGGDLCMFSTHLNQKERKRAFLLREFH
jgi:hypothetical protein